MSKPQRRYLKEYRIVFTGYSRGKDGEKTFMEDMIDKVMLMLKSFASMFKGMTMEIEEM